MTPRKGILILLVASGCTQQYGTPGVDIPLPEPGPATMEVYRSESFRRNPCQVADYELKLHLELCQWRHEPFNPARYSFYERSPEHPDWGSYVVRGYVDTSGRLWRYRVKVRQAGDVWYAIEVSHYVMVELEHPALEDDTHAPHL